jgi:hypothetical protein
MRSPSFAFVMALGACAATAEEVKQTPSAVERARPLLDHGEARSAVAILEEALAGASTDERRPLLATLRVAYEAAIREAVASGSGAEVEEYRENLAILKRTTARTRRPEPSVAGPPAPSADLVPLPPDPPKPVSAPSDLEAADGQFRGRRYEEAGRLYAAMARSNRLPTERREAWAYCRMAGVVARINASPRDSSQWAAIQDEIQQIRRLSPRNWYAEYLRNLALERAGRPARAGSRQVVFRGAAPDDEASPKAVAPAASPTAPSAPAAVPDRVGSPGEAIGNWKVWNTPSFRILHADPALAERVARVAEMTRAEQTKRWGGTPPPASWNPRCDVYLYPTAELFHKMTGQPPGAPGFSTMGLSAGRVVARRVNLRVDHPNLLKSIVAHEVTHVVLADLFPTQQVPRWADEGMAVLSEPAGEQDLRAADLTAPLASGEMFALRDLVGMDYPNGRYWSLYYAQSVSLTRFLVEQATPARFVEFVRGAQRAGFEPELRRIYGIASLDDLQSRWLEHARTTSSAVAARRTDTIGEAELRRE